MSLTPRPARSALYNDDTKVFKVCGDVPVSSSPRGGSQSPVFRVLTAFCWLLDQADSTTGLSTVSQSCDISTASTCLFILLKFESSSRKLTWPLVHLQINSSSTSRDRLADSRRASRRRSAAAALPLEPCRSSLAAREPGLARALPRPETARSSPSDGELPLLEDSLLRRGL